MKLNKLEGNRACDQNSDRTCQVPAMGGGSIDRTFPSAACFALTQRERRNSTLAVFSRSDSDPSAIFNVNVCPSHTNIAQFKGVDGFVAVGIGPLNHDEDCVQLGEPDS
jgi:hypothetical protein